MTVNKVTIYLHGIDNRVGKNITRIDTDTRRALFYPLTGYDDFQLQTVAQVDGTYPRAVNFDLNTKNTTQIYLHWYLLGKWRW